MPRRRAVDTETGRELALLRRSRRISQGRLGEILGVSAQQVGKYERGESLISHDTWTRAMRYLEEPGGRGRGFASPEAPPYAAPRDVTLSELSRSLAEAEDGIRRALSILERALAAARLLK